MARTVIVDARTLVLLADTEGKATSAMLVEKTPGTLPHTSTVDLRTREEALDLVGALVEAFGLTPDEVSDARFGGVRA